MKKSNVFEREGQEEINDPLTELLRKGAAQLIYRAVDAELQEVMSWYSDQKTEDGSVSFPIR